jgi:hypothetical protein
MTIAANLLNAASDAYDDSALGFRDYFGRKTVEKLNIREALRSKSPIPNLETPKTRFTGQEKSAK